MQQLDKYVVSEALRASQSALPELNCSELLLQDFLLPKEVFGRPKNTDIHNMCKTNPSCTLVLARLFLPVHLVIQSGYR